MMQMLAAGGMPVLTDGERQPDEDNPHGYYEWEQIKLLPKQPDCIDQAEGRVVKCISQLLFALPAGRNYQIIFMERPLREVLASQAEMIRRRGSAGATVNDSMLLKAFENHLKQVELWFKAKSNVSVCRVRYHDVLSDPIGTSHILREFLRLPLDVNAMAGKVVPSLYRQRTTESGPK
jgi:hypothetical protein